MSEWEERWEGTMNNLGVDPKIIYNNDGGSRAGVENGVMILKPLRDVTAKECGVFFYWRRMSSLSPNGLFLGDEDVDQGIRKLTRGALLARDFNFDLKVPVDRRIGRASLLMPLSFHPFFGLEFKDFIVGLDKDFPSTVNAIVRTIGKVTPKTDMPLGRCRLCQR